MFRNACGTDLREACPTHGVKLLQISTPKPLICVCNMMRRRTKLLHFSTDVTFLWEISFMDFRFSKTKKACGVKFLADGSSPELLLFKAACRSQCRAEPGRAHPQATDTAAISISSETGLR